MDENKPQFEKGEKIEVRDDLFGPWETRVFVDTDKDVYGEVIYCCENIWRTSETTYWKYARKILKRV